MTISKATYERWVEESKGLTVSRTPEEAEKMRELFTKDREAMEKRQREAGLIKD